MPMRTGESTTMTESPNPSVPAVEARVAAGAAELRRFHFAGPEPGAGARVGALLPAALDTVVARVSPGRPALGSVADALELATALAIRRLEGAVAAFAPTARELAAAAESLLAAEPDRTSRGQRTEQIAQRLGALGDLLVDPARLGATVARRRGAPSRSEARQRGLEEALERLRGFERDRPVPIWVTDRGARWQPTGARVITAAEPALAALAVFEQAAAPVVELARAVRRVRLETEGTFDAERHEPALAAFDRRSLSAAELALVPPVFVVLDAVALAGAAFATVARLLRSSRPVQVVVPATGGEAPDGDERFDPLAFGLGHREAFVQSGSLAAGAALERGFERALAGLRPALHLLDVPAAPQVRDLPAATLAAARVAGRAAPIVACDPEAGSGWAARMTLDGNPDPDRDWPAAGDAGVPARAGAATAASFTFADAALIDPRWRAHFLPAGGGDDLVAIVEWLDLPADEAAHRLPFVVGVAPDGSTSRLVVSRALARATADGREAWRALAELAGVRARRPDAAPDTVSAERSAGETAAGGASAPAAAAELEQVRARADADVVSRLGGALEELARGGV
jgi:hypothetical protein